MLRTHAIHLYGEDAAWLHMEDATNPMVVLGMLELGARVPVARVRALFEERLAGVPRFHARVLEPRFGVGAPQWKPDPSFSVAHHVDHVELADGNDDALRAFVSREASALLPRDKPLWRVFVIDRPGKGTTLLFRVHHAVGDGFALLGVLLSLCDAPVDVPEYAPRDANGWHTVDVARALWRLVSLPPDPPSALRGPLSAEKRIAWSKALPLEGVKFAARARSSTVNDVLVAAVAGALRRYLARRGEDVDRLTLRAMVPVNLRRTPPRPVAPANRFGLVLLDLPISVRDPTARVAAVKRAMDRLKSTPEAVTAMGLLQIMGLGPRAIENIGVRFFARKASLVLTNVPGPREKMQLGGARVERVAFWVPQSGRLGVGVSILSYAGEITLGVMADARLVRDPDALIEDLHVELAALEFDARAVAPSIVDEGEIAR